MDLNALREQAQVFPGVGTDHITIGVELEIVVFKLPSGIDVATLLERALTPIALQIPYRQADELFDIKDDASIKTSHPTKDLQGVGIEVATPILRGGGWVWLVPAMCEAINSACRRVGASVKFNKSTGLHVHVALSDDYTITQLKRIARAVILFEEDMNYHHPPHRRPDPADLLSYYGPCRMSPALAGRTRPEMLEIIDTANTTIQLLKIINGNRVYPSGTFVRHYAYNFCAVRKFGTIEFRQGNATSDAEIILEWIGNIIRFVTSAVQTTEAVFNEWATLDGGVTDPDILARFGIPPLDSEPAPIGNRKRNRLQRIGTGLVGVVRRMSMRGVSDV